jgi:hypothetical protein
VECKFQIFYGRIRAILNNGGLEDRIRSGVWAECARTTAFLSNHTSIKAKDKCPYPIMFGRGSKPTSQQAYEEPDSSQDTVKFWVLISMKLSPL